jgi:tyrosine-protein phosphatase YwqE
MFSFFRNKPKAPLVSPVRIDMHSHLIPGIDDGAKTLEESLHFIKELAELGYEKLYTTPHIYHDLYPNDRTSILEKLQTLKAEVQNQAIPIEIHAAAEYFMDDHFEELLNRKELLVLKDNIVLVEMSFMAPPPKVEDYIFSMRTKGYQPILAHPERYGFLGNSLAKFERLKDLGCHFQLNLLSLSGRYGSSVQKIAKKLLKAGMIDYLGTDLHNETHLQELKSLFRSKTMTKITEKYVFKNATL